MSAPQDDRYRAALGQTLGHASGQGLERALGQPLGQTSGQALRQVLSTGSFDRLLVRRLGLGVISNPKLCRCLSACNCTQPAILAAFINEDSARMFLKKVVQVCKKTARVLRA